MGLIIKNGVIYNGADSEPVVYSLDEREVGVWVDGKPLYEKTINFVTGSSGDAYLSTPINIPNIETIFIVDGFLLTSTGSFMLKGYKGSAAVNEFVGLVNVSENSFDYRCGSGLVGCDAFVTFQYTKTTDTPGSGTWTPSGVKADHYSTNEHVVGTWIDGSTLYEKTYALLNLSGHPSDWTSIEEIGIGTLVKAIGTLYKSNGEICSADNTTIRFCYNPQVERGCLCYYYGSDQSNITDMYLTFQYTKTTS